MVVGLYYEIFTNHPCLWIKRKECKIQFTWYVNCQIFDLGYFPITFNGHHICILWKKIPLFANSHKTLRVLRICKQKYTQIRSANIGHGSWFRVRNHNSLDAKTFSRTVDIGFFVCALCPTVTFVTPFIQSIDQSNFNYTPIHVAQNN